MNEFILSNLSNLFRYSSLASPPQWGSTREAGDGALIRFESMTLSRMEMRRGHKPGEAFSEAEG